MNEQTEPWRVVKRDDYTQRQTNIGVLIDGHVYELGDVNNERNRINAHLIAAAQDMLALLEDINHELHVAMMDLQETGFSDGSSLPASLQLRLRDVVDKANGTQQ